MKDLILLLLLHSLAAAYIVNTTDGQVRGRQIGRMIEFLGIPYASQPIGSLRFAFPIDPSYRTFVLNATEEPPSCPQIDSVLPKIPSFSFNLSRQSEGCLYLNVFRPAGQTNESLPVIVFFHGGSFIAGGISQHQYNATNLAQNAVVFTVQYRLGPFGFLAFQNNVPTNLGLYDQLQALKWVQKNAINFGGDSTKVTMWGESAGAISVCLHYLSPLSQAYFQRAVVEGGPCSQINLFKTKYFAISTQGMQFATAIGCKTMNCLRKRSVQQILTALPLYNVSDSLGSNWLPVIDGKIILSSPRFQFSSLKHHAKPLLLGANHDSGSIFVRFPMSAVAYTAKLISSFGAWSTPIAAEYSPLLYNGYYNSFSQILTDSFFMGPSRYISDNLASKNVFLYDFNAIPSWSHTTHLGCYHSSELAFFWNFPPSPNVTFTPNEQKLAHFMSESLLFFASFGNLTSPWQPNTFLGLDANKIKIEPSFRSQRLSFWDATIDQICFTIPCLCTGDC